MSNMLESFHLFTDYYYYFNKFLPAEKETEFFWQMFECTL